MAYATHTDVSSFLGRSAFSASSTPTSTQVTAMIALADGIIDTYLGVTSPQTDHNNLLVSASCMLTAEILKRGAAMASGSSKDMGATQSTGGFSPLMSAEIKELLAAFRHLTDIACVRECFYQTNLDNGWRV